MNPGTIVILGCGHLGSHLAVALDRLGHAVDCVDQDAFALASLPPPYGGRQTLGALLSLDVLERARVHEADVVIASTGRDSVNLAAALVAKKLFGVRATLTRVTDPREVDGHQLLGVEPVCATSIAARAILNRVAERHQAVERSLPETRPQEWSPASMSASLFIVVVGCGRLGSHLANLLSQAGHRVVIIDRNESSFEVLLPESYSGSRIEGDASEPAVLRRARIEDADLLIAATSEDNLNIMVALTASKVFGVRRVMARVFDPTREDLYRERGLETVCPTLLAGEVFLRLVESALNGGAEA